MPVKPNETDLRRLILDTTRHLLVRNGYQSLSMRRIARAIGYSATSIYLHFESKDALFHALIDEGMERLYGELQRVRNGSTDPRAHLEALCRRYVDFGLSNPEYYEIMFMLRPEHMHRYPADKYRRARRNLDLIAAVLAEGEAAGVLSVQNPRVAASGIWATLHGAVSLLIARRLDVRIDAAEFVETLIHQLVRSVSARSVEPESP